MIDADNGVIVVMLLSIINKINLSGSIPDYARLYDGTIKSSAGVDVMLGGSDSVDADIEPLTGFRSKFIVIIRTTSKNLRQEAVIDTINNHENHVLRPLINWVPVGADDMEIGTTRQTEIVGGKRTVVGIETEMSVNLKLEPLPA